MTVKSLLMSALAASVMGGCASPTPYFDEHFGLAVNAAKAQQTLNPDASRNPDPVTGIDGTVADNAIEQYHNSFKAPEPTFPVINIGVGASGR